MFLFEFGGKIVGDFLLIIVQFCSQSLTAEAYEWKFVDRTRTRSRISGEQ